MSDSLSSIIWNETINAIIQGRFIYDFKYIFSISLQHLATVYTSLTVRNNDVRDDHNHCWKVIIYSSRAIYLILKCKQI